MGDKQEGNRADNRRKRDGQKDERLKCGTNGITLIAFVEGIFGWRKTCPGVCVSTFPFAVIRLKMLLQAVARTQDKYRQQFRLTFSINHIIRRIILNISVMSVSRT